MWNRTGTASVTQGSAVVTGLDTTWNTEQKGWEFILEGEDVRHEIRRIASDTEIELYAPIERATASGLSFQIMPTQGLELDIRRRLISAITVFNDIREELALGVFALWEAQPGNEVSTVAEFLAELVGPEGNDAYEVWLADGNTGTKAEFFEFLSQGVIASAEVARDTALDAAAASAASEVSASAYAASAGVAEGNAVAASAVAANAAAVASLAAQAAGAALFASVADGEAGTGDGDVFIVQRSPGSAVYRNTAGSGSFLGWLGELIYDDATAFLTANDTGFSAGQIIRTRREGFAYEAAPAPAISGGVVNAGGARFYVSPGERGFDVLAFGADRTGVNDSLAAFEACSEAAGIGAQWVIPPGRYDLSSYFEANYEGQMIVGEGVTINNGWVNARIGIHIDGRITIDPLAFGSRKPWFGVVDVNGQQGVSRAFKVNNVDGPAYMTGGTYRAQVAVAFMEVDAKDCAIVAAHNHGLGGIMSFSRKHVPRALSSISAGGSGYTDGRWMAPLTYAPGQSGAGKDAVLAFEVSGGVVVDQFVAVSGEGYVSGEVLTFEASSAIDKNQTVMPGGSGFRLTVGTVMDDRTWFNKVSIKYAANGGWYGGVVSHGSYNYCYVRDLYLEAIWTRNDSPFSVADGVSTRFKNLEILVNDGTAVNNGKGNEITNRAVKLINMPNASGVTVFGGRTGNPFSDSENPRDDLMDFGVRSSVKIDAFSDVVSTRGDEWRPFEPVLYGSGSSTTFAPDFTGGSNLGLFRESNSTVELLIELEFATNNYTGNTGNLYISIANLIARLKGELPNSEQQFWNMRVSEPLGLVLHPDTVEVYGSLQNNADFIRLWQLTKVAGGASSRDPVGNGELRPNTTGCRLVLSGFFKY